MTNEEKILLLVAKVQCDVLELKERIEALESGRIYGGDRGRGSAREINRRRFVMSNEEKILSLLTKMQSDIDALRTEVDSIKNNAILKAAEDSQSKKRKNTYAALEAMASLLDDDEKDALGKYMEAEMARKVALYG